MWRYKIFKLLLIFLVLSSISKANEHAVYRFIENMGQWNSDVLFKATIPGGDLYVLKNKLKYVFYESDHKGHNGISDLADSNLRKHTENMIHAIELSFYVHNFL